MRRGLGGLAIHCRLPGVTVGRLRKRSFPVGLIKAGLRSSRVAPFVAASMACISSRISAVIHLRSPFRLVNRD